MRLISILSVMFLIGCESDFDKCMNIETPRAQLALGLVDQQTEIKEVAQLLEQHHFIYEKIASWHEANPEPTDDEYDEELKAVWLAAWSAAAGFDGFSQDQVDEVYKQVRARINELVLPRALEHNCWGRGDRRGQRCDDGPIDAEIIAEKRDAERNAGYEDRQWGMLDNIAIVRKALSETILMKQEAVVETKAKVGEIATLACNSNGFYE